MPWAVAYWETRQDESGLGVDWAEALDRCWRCGYSTILQRCHIVPASLGGSEDASNTVALCAQCHDEAPNVTDPGEMWRWIRETAVSLYDTFWSVAAFTKARAEFDDNTLAAMDPDVVLGHIKELYNRVSYHFGQGSGGPRITPATRLWVLRSALRLATQERPDMVTALTRFAERKKFLTPPLECETLPV